MRADTRIVQGRGWNSTSSTVGVPRYGFRDTDFTMARAAGASAFVDIFLSLVAYAKHKLDSLWSMLKHRLGRLEVLAHGYRCGRTLSAGRSVTKA